MYRTMQILQRTPFGEKSKESCRQNYQTPSELTLAPAIPTACRAEYDRP